MTSVAFVETARLVSPITVCSVALAISNYSGASAALVRSQCHHSTKPRRYQEQQECPFLQSAIPPVSWCCTSAAVPHGLIPMSLCFHPWNTVITDFPKPLLRLTTLQLRELSPKPEVLSEAHLANTAHCEEMGHGADGFRCKNRSGHDEGRDCW